MAVDATPAPTDPPTTPGAGPRESVPGSGRPGLVAVVLAAGAGTRLAPLTWWRPKALCPVGGVALVDRAVERVQDIAADVAVNVHHHRDQLEAHLGRLHPSVHVSVEEPAALGTAGALGQLRPWIDRRPVMVVNADTWASADLVDLVRGWDGVRIRLFVHGQDRLDRRSRVVACLLPGDDVMGITSEPAGLYERCWAPAADRGRLEVVRADGVFFDCGTPESYLAANLHAVDRRSGAGRHRRPEVPGAEAGSIVAPDAMVTGTVRRSVIGARAGVAGTVTDSVVWDDAGVARGEYLWRAVRAGPGRTVVVR